MALRVSLSSRGLLLRGIRHLCPTSRVLSFSSEPSPENEKTKTPASFPSLLRNSPWIQMGNPKGKVVVGDIYHVVEDDLYIDIGHKFPVVCRRPKHKGEQFRRGSKVRILIKSLELSQKFLGYENEMTLMEADGVLLGLYSGKQN
eukprot:TRINITY_DN8073_c0_g1_i1.p1 TRINITY_DN8073_c0_g1~~TRINITY_DN8073_c0_g1_i1.p1  ORF type:complete len:153 (-),score=13.52 TRINITY_DN8073_c0_g1_i1:79-513(-)